MDIKRILSFVEEVRGEAGRRAEPPLRKAAVVAIVQNPFAGRYVEDLSPLTKASEAIAREISALAVGLLAPGKPVSYGKAAVVESFGLAGYGYHAHDEFIDANSIVLRLYLMTRLLTELGKAK